MLLTLFGICVRMSLSFDIRVFTLNIASLGSEIQIYFWNSDKTSYFELEFQKCSYYINDSITNEFISILLQYIILRC